MILTLCVPMLRLDYLTTLEELQYRWQRKHRKVEMDETLIELLDKQALIKVVKEVPDSGCCNVMHTIAKKKDIKIGYIGTVIDKDGVRVFIAKLLRYTSGYNFIITANDDSMLTQKNIERLKAICKEIAIDSKLPIFYFVEKRSFIGNAKFVCVCSYTILHDPDNAEFIIAKIRSNKIMLYLTEGFDFSEIPLKLLIKFFANSKIVFGNYNEMEILRKLIYQNKYTTVEEMVIRKSKRGRLFVFTNSERVLNIAREGIITCKPLEYKNTGSFLPQYIDEHFFAGFVSEYYLDPNNIERCIQKGIHWIQNYYITNYPI